MTLLTNLKIWMLERKLRGLKIELQYLKKQAQSLFEQELHGGHAHTLNLIDLVEDKIRVLVVNIDSILPPAAAKEGE